jgi:hypothetical protein
MRAALALLVLCWVAPAASVALGTSPAEAQEPAPAGAAAVPTAEPLTPRVALRHDLWVDGAATGVLAGSLVAWSVAKSDALSAACVLCDGAQPGKVNGLDDLFRSAFRRREGAAASTAGDIVTYGAGPAIGLALTVSAAVADGRGDEAPLNSLLVLESSLAAIAVNEAVGAFVRRERPRVHALEGDAKSASLADTDAASSFPSGPTASIMAITAATATIATLRGYRLAPLVWIVGSTVGLTATYLQLAADKSYFTDNLAGAAVGLGVGVLVPVVFHARVEPRSSAALRIIEGATLTSSTVPGGRVVGLGWAF